MFSYRTETELQGALVFANGGRLEREDNILGHYRFLFILQPLWHNRPAKLSNLMKKTQNKGYYAVQGHSKSSRSVPIESLHATSY